MFFLLNIHTLEYDFFNIYFNVIQKSFSLMIIYRLYCFVNALFVLKIID